MLEDTVVKQKELSNQTSDNCMLITMNIEVAGAALLTWLFFHSIQDPFNDIIHLRGLDSLQHFH